MPSTLTSRTARKLHIAADQLDTLADHCEARTRELMAEGHSQQAAMEQAATETTEVARSLGILRPLASI
jgi:multidrug resistance efflux pump